MIRIEVRTSIPYDTIAAQVSGALERTPYTIATRLVRGQVHVRDVAVRPSGKRLVVTATLDAALAWPLPRVRGVVHVSGTPVYDAEAQTLRLGDVSIAGDVDHVLARAALAFKRRAVADAIADFTLDLESVLGELRKRLNDALAGHVVAPSATLHGHVETLRVDDVLLEASLTVVASASGRLGVRFDAPSPRALEP